MYVAKCFNFVTYGFFFWGVFLHLVLYFVTLFKKIIEIKEYIFSQKNFFFKKFHFAHHLNVFFKFLLHFNTFRCFLENYFPLMVNMESLYLYEPIRDPPSLSLHFLPTQCLIMMKFNKK
jgi:hypothetical protein